jgi:hypothetical protein
MCARCSGRRARKRWANGIYENATVLTRQLTYIHTYVLYIFTWMLWHVWNTNSIGTEKCMHAPLNTALITWKTNYFEILKPTISFFINWLRRRSIPNLKIIRIQNAKTGLSCPYNLKCIYLGKRRSSNCSSNIIVFYNKLSALPNTISIKPNQSSSICVIYWNLRRIQLLSTVRTYCMCMYVCMYAIDSWKSEQRVIDPYNQSIQKASESYSAAQWITIAPPI